MERCWKPGSLKSFQGKDGKPTAPPDFFEFRSAATLLTINLRLTQLLDCGLGTYRGVINLLKGVRPGLGGEYRHDLNVPVIVVINRLPVPKGLRRMQAIRGSMQQKMKAFGERANSL